ncbi:S10 family peptidase [Sphingomonas sp.]|uniref:S10 family peptidase n=1 Tax=Sphingomonas sp. TaxID=28214 RepID=UPI002DD62355|nr:peptidase S10 [Sphingomonas sp.]
MRHILVFAAAALISVPLAAQDAPPLRPAASKAEDVPPPNRSVTRHRGVFGGQAVAYTAIAGETYLKADDGTPKAAIFSVSYIKDGVDPRRPVTFLFNGGPGSGSVWLHMGAFGPKRVAIPSDARDDGAPPYPILDNPDSLLDVTDIVFIDPVGTGYSHALGKTDPKEYYGVTQDARSIADFIRLWLNEHGRWNAPKYLGGESYGTTRSAAVLNQLEGSYNDVAFNGVLLISTVLDFGAGADTPGNEMTHILNLPSMAVTALYHGKAQATGAAAFADEARRWATGPYAAALLKGNALSQEERASVRRDLARFTGLSERYLDQADLRVEPGRFYKELLRDRGLTVGRLDSRYTGRDFDNAGETPDNDPSFYGIDAGYTAAINAFTRGDLNYRTDRSYVTIGSLGAQWDWRLGGGRDNNVYMNVAPYIGKALRENSGLRIFVGQGWYDFATPFFAAEYSLSRTGYDKSRIHFEYYDSGHMMYVRDEDRAKLTRDVRAFIRGR